MTDDPQLLARREYLSFVSQGCSFGELHPGTQEVITFLARKHLELDPPKILIQKQSEIVTEATENPNG